MSSSRAVDKSIICCLYAERGQLKASWPPYQREVWEKRIVEKNEKDRKEGKEIRTRRQAMIK
jgi:hypothetical protein